ncbi:MAG: agmatinase [Candidatus Kariarchaeum pelagius]
MIGDFGSFGGLVYEDMEIQDADILLIGVPYEGGTSGNKGTSFAPYEIRKFSTDLQTMTRYSLDLNDIAILDMGDISIFPLNDEMTREKITKTFDGIFENEKPIITIGGDHSITYPIIKSLSNRGKVGVIWFDAHRDLLDELINSKYSHGSSLRRSIELDNVNSEDIMLIGTRYMEQTEQLFIENNDIYELRMVDLEENKFDLTDFEKQINKIAKRVDYFYVSIDIDVLDPAFIPGTGTPVGGGMTSSQLYKMIKCIPCKVTAFDITEVSPPGDQSLTTVKTTLGLITEILGQIKLLRE